LHSIQWKREIEKDYAEIESIARNQVISIGEAEKIWRLTNPVPISFKVYLFIIPLKNNGLELKSPKLFYSITIFNNKLL